MELISALFVGLFLGILGGGGSILVVPSLIYLFQFSPKNAIASSLLIVSLISLIGVIKERKKINYKIAILFGIPSMIGTFAGAKIAFYLSESTQMIFFSLIMLATSFFMFKEQKEIKSKINLKYLIPIEGIIVGIITGIVGVGGGFMIVPALNLIGGISMAVAIPTSLLIISLKSLSGYIGYLNIVSIDYLLLIQFIGIASIGLLIGLQISNKLPEKVIKKVFAIFLILISLFITYQFMFLK